MSATPLVLWLDEFDDDHRPLVGGKFAELAALHRRGIQVPDGFAVVAEAQVRAFRSAGVLAPLRELAAQVADRPEAAAAIAEQCAELLGATPVPAEVAEAILAGYDGLIARRRDPQPQVAVRSSALREDAADASSAGQYESFLGISGGDGVLDAVRRCWVSLFSERAMLYRARQGIDIASCPMAVAVLELVEARSAGVAFSVHPVTGAPDRLVIESTFGWGEALVQGRVQPDRFEVDRSDLRVLRRNVARKAWVSSRSGSVITEVPMPEVLAEVASLDDAETVTIAETLLQVEQHLGHWADMEWVWPRSGPGPVVVQARPETVHSLAAASAAPPQSPAANPFAGALRFALPGTMP